ncbi:MAG: tetratricopeptide repeat protein [Planctomycetes bacterium]|nr:tetratricopeptide repeat protein [Planctomycetota bacterium]
MGLLICVMLSLYRKDDPTAESPRPAQRETETFSPPTRLYHVIVPSSSDDPEALLEAQAKLVAEMRSEALALVKHLMTTFPLDENADILQGDIYEDFREDTLSVAAWKQALTKNPRRSEVYEKLGRVAAAQGNQEQAMAYWNQGLQTNANTPNLRWLIANVYHIRGEPAPAADLLVQECMLSPPAARNYFLLGQCYRQLQQFEQAAVNYQKAVEISPDYYNAYYGLAHVCRLTKQMDRAKEALEKFRALKQRADASEDRQIPIEEITQTRKGLAAYYIKAYKLYLRHQKIRPGEPLLERAVAIAPDWPFCLEKLAAHHYRLERPAEAMKLYRQAQHLDPNQPMYAVNIGTLYRQLGQYDRAEETFKQVIGRFPSYSPGYRELVNLNLKTGKHLKETLSLAQKAVQLKGSADHYYTLSKVHHVNGNGQAALSAIEKAIRLDPDDPKYRSFDAIIRRH